MPYASVKAKKKGPQKATDWSGIKKKKITQGNQPFLVSVDK
jgi:hypothetical protein